MLYHVTAHKPDSVSCAIRANFTGPTDINLIISKWTHLQIYLLVNNDLLASAHHHTDNHSSRPDPSSVTASSESGSNPSTKTLARQSLRMVTDVPIYGRIASIHAFRPENRDTDLLVISTERCNVVVLSFDPMTQRLVPEATGHFNDPMARLADPGQLGLVDPQNRLIGLHISQGMFKVIPIYHSQISPSSWHSLVNSSQSVKGKGKARPPIPGEFGEAFNARMDELLVVSLALLHTPTDKHPILAVLHQDSKESRFVTQYDVMIKEKKLVLKYSAVKVENGSALLIPVPLAAGGGVLVVGEQCIALHSPSLQKPIVLPIKATLIKCFNQVDAGFRYLLGDYEGQLYILVIIFGNGIARELKMTLVGQTVQASSIAYLTDGYLFIASHFGDSELQLIVPEDADTGNVLSLCETFPNLAPISDFCVVDIEKQGQVQLVACSGAQRDGSLRIIRNGIGVEEIGQLEDMQEMTGVWGVKPFSAARFDHLLVLSFIGETRLQKLDGDAMGEVDLAGGFRTLERTLWCQNMPLDLLVQITPSCVVVMTANEWVTVSEWSPPPEHIITHASVYHNMVLISLGGGFLYLLEASNQTLLVKSMIQLDREVSCLHICRLDALNVSICAAGCWGDNSIRLFNVPDLLEIRKDILAGDTIPRSILLVEFDNAPYLLVSLGDGQLFNFHINASLELTERKKITLGTQPITLRRFQSNGRTHVFAASDRPTVIFVKSGQLLYSNVNVREVSHVSQFNSPMAEGGLAFSSDGVLKIGTIETVQKLHIKTVKLGETPRRIAYHEKSHTFGILTIFSRNLPNGDLADISCLRILDGQGYDILDSIELQPFEIASSLIVTQLTDDDTEYYVVGTGFAFPHEDEPVRGRILIFTVVDMRHLQLVHEYEIRGSAYSMVSVHGRLIAGVNSNVLVLRWNSDTLILELQSTNHGHVLALSLAVRGDFVLVADLIKSITLLQFDLTTESLTELAHDHDSNWMAAVEAISDDTFLGADSSMNLFALGKQSDAVSEEERQRLRPEGWFHLGELVNRFRKGSLTLHVADDALTPPATPEILYCTVHGTIGVVARIASDDTAKVLCALQEALQAIVQGVGGLIHSDWRRYRTERRTIDSAGIIDGDLIELFLELERGMQEHVAAEVSRNASITFEALIKMVEDLTRIH
ncbi:hypothetical protein BASA61_009017 [Batrachochytrium salamandrivorans]|nr:hypothetical protein BASA61_009017 [Batrachochytrium salamandrivorans]KAH9263682.1 hypothetical protein BASA83_012893 [Batrachochytrium salamandrivorans]